MTLAAARVVIEFGTARGGVLTPAGQRSDDISASLAVATAAVADPDSHQRVLAVLAYLRSPA